MLEVVDAAAGEGRLVVGVLLAGQHAHERLAHQQRRSHALDDLAGDDGPIGDRDRQVDHRELGSGHHERPDAPVDGVAGCPRGQRLLGRLLQDDVHHRRAVGQLAGSEQDLLRRGDLVGGEQRQRMVDAHRAAPGAVGVGSRVRRGVAGCTRRRPAGTRRGRPSSPVGGR